MNIYNRDAILDLPTEFEFISFASLITVGAGCETSHVVRIDLCDDASFDDALTELEPALEDAKRDGFAPTQTFFFCNEAEQAIYAFGGIPAAGDPQEEEASASGFSPEDYRVQ